MKKDPSELIDFPCHYQFKAVGLAGDIFVEGVVAAVEKHASLGRDSIRCRPSGKGNYQSVSILVTLHSYEQLTAIYKEMKQVPDLKMLL